MTKTTTLQVTGRLVWCEVRDEPEVDYNYTHRYSPNAEHRVKFLDCTLATDDGHLYYFSTPRSGYRITSVPGAAVITFRGCKRDQTTGEYVFPVDHPWFRMQGTIAVATPERAADKMLVAAVKMGDTLTVKGRIKKTGVNSVGKPYTALNHVKRLA